MNASTRRLLMVALILLSGCSGPSSNEPSDAGTDASTRPDAGGSPNDSGATRTDGGASQTDAGTSNDAAVDVDASMSVEDMAATDMGTPEPCDYRTVDDVLVIEAESLPIVEDWSIETNESGYSGDGYIEWTGQSHNNDPSHGVMSVALRVDTPGRYQMQWHVRIGQGTNTTEHNDAFVRFGDADDFYGLKGEVGAEIRRYPRPQCEDPAFTDAKEALPEVDVADCVRSSSSDGWIKAYSSGASDWRWSTKTSDNDASDIMVEFDQPGVYTLELAARADHFLIDRIVLHLESVENSVVRDLTLTETVCD